MILFRTIIATAKAFNSLYERSDFSYRGISFRNRFNQEWASSTTHLRVLNVGFRSICFFSSPRGQLCGMNALAISTSSFPTFAASRQRFWGMASSPWTIFLAFNSGLKAMLSYRLTPVTTSDKGTPFSSTGRYCFVSFFLRDPVDSVQQTLGQAGPQCSILQRPPKARQYPLGRHIRSGRVSRFYETNRPLPIAETCDALLPSRHPQIFTRQSIPNNAGTKHIHDCAKYKRPEYFRFLPPPGLRMYVFSFVARGVIGINGSTKFQNTPVTSHVLIRAMPYLYLFGF